MKKDKIALQLYTLRDYLKTPADMAVTLKKVKKIGYDAVQLSGMGPIDEKELLKMLDGEGLTCCATHEPGKTIVEEPQKVVDRLAALKCKYTAYPWPHLGFANGESDVHSLAKALNASGKVLYDAGQVLTYHNHDIEFQKFGKKTALDMLYDETDKRYLQGELDTYWVQSGGACPVEWIEKLTNRLPLLHLKERGFHDKSATIMHIGGGNLNWKKIIAAGEKAGTEWFIVEQDTCILDPFVSVELSLKYLIEEV